MAADPQGHGLAQHPPVGGARGVVVVQAPIRRIVAVHGVPGRPKGGVVGSQVDLPVTHRIERPGLREGLSSMVLQKSILALAEFRHKWQ